MTEYIVIGDETWPIDTQEEIDAACEALADAGINSAEVWRSPHPIAWIREHGDPDGVLTHFVMLASRDVDPVANGNMPPPA